MNHYLCDMTRRFVVAGFVCIVMTMTISVRAFNSSYPAFVVVSDSSIDKKYMEVFDLLESGADREKAFRMSQSLYDKLKTNQLSTLERLNIMTAHARALQESRDAHAEAHNILKQVRNDLSTLRSEDIFLRRQLYRGLTLSNLVMNTVDSAVKYAMLAEETGSRLNSDTSCQRVADYFYLGYTLIESGRDSAGFAAVNRAMDIAESFCRKTSIYTIDAYRLMGRYYIKSNYQASKAIPYLQLALKQSLEIKDADRAFKSLYYICRTAILNGDTLLVRQYLPTFDSIHFISDDITAVKNRIAKLDIEYEIARRSGRIKRAMEKKSEFGNIVRNHLPERKTAIFASYHALLEMAVKLDESKKIRHYITELTYLKDQYKINTDQLLAYFQSMTNGYMALDEWEPALKYAEMGLDLLGVSGQSSRLKESTVNHVLDLYYYRLFLEVFARDLRKQVMEKPTVESLTMLVNYQKQIVAITRKMIEVDDERISLQSPKEIASDFENLISSLIDLYQTTRNTRSIYSAYEYVDMASNLTFFRGKNLRSAAGRSPGTDSLLTKKRELLDELSEIRVAQTQSENLERSMESAALKLRLDISKIDLYLGRTEPLLMADIRAVQSGDLAQFQRAVLDQNTAAIHYFIHRDLHAFAVLEDTLIYIPLRITDDMSDLIQKFKRSCASPITEFSEFSGISKQLGLILLEPVLSELPPSIDRLIISPYGDLADLSFESLVIGDTESKDEYGKLPFVIRRYAISYMTSMSVLLDQESKDISTGNASVLAVAPNYDFNSNEADSLTALMYKEVERSHFLPLFGARREVKFIGEMVRDSKVLLDEQAKESIVRKQMHHHRIWHFAMHGLLNEEDPMLSALYFPQSDSTDDGYLTAAELYEFQLNAELAILGACNTGVGKFDYTSGTMSLARAFAFSGTRSIVLSNWPAADKATSEFFPVFYRGLIEGKPKDVALRQAKLDWLDETGSDRYCHPYYWNTFTLWGSRDAIEHLSGTSPWSTMIAIGVVSIGLLALATSYIRRRRVRIKA